MINYKFKNNLKALWTPAGGLPGGVDLKTRFEIYH